MNKFKVRWRRRLGHLWQVCVWNGTSGFYGYGSTRRAARLDALENAKGKAERMMKRCTEIYG